MRRKRNSRSVAFVALAILGATAVGVVYYLISYQASRKSYFLESRLRALGVLTEQIEAAVASRAGSLANAVDDPLTLYSRTDLEEVGSLLGADDLTLLKRGLDADLCPGAWMGEPLIRTGPPRRVPERSTAPFEDGAATRPGSSMPKRDTELFISYRGVCATVGLNSLITRFLKDGDFDGAELFVAHERQVLFEHGPATIRLAELVNESAAHYLGRLILLGTAPDKKPNAPTPAPAEHGSAIPLWRELTVSSTVHQVELGGVAYKLFTHPIRLTSDGAAVLGLMVPVGQFTSEVHRLSFGALSYVPLLLVIAVLAFPLLKIGTMGKRDRLRTRDMRFAAVSLLATAALLVLLGLDAFAYKALEDALDHELQGTSESLRTNLRAELRRAATALDAYATRYGATRAHSWEQPDASPSERWCRPLDPDPLRSHQLTELFQPGRCLRPLDAAGGVDPNAPQLSDSECALIGDLRAQYPFFDMLVLIDACGRQHEKWTTRSQRTPLIDASGFPVFQDAIAGRLWPIGGDALAADADSQPKTSLAATLNIQVNPNSGKLIPLLSKPIRVDNQSVGVAVIAPELMSLLDPVLPPGVEFAVVENDGRVALHSRKLRALYESFFDETTISRSIRATIESHGARILEGDYHGRRTRFWVHPIEESPWTLIVFRDKELPRALDLDIIMTWAALVLICLGVAVIVRTFVSYALPADRPDWFWPSALRASEYHEGLLLTLGAGAALGAIILRSSVAPRPSIPAAVAIIFSTLGYTYRLLAMPPLENGAGRIRRRRCAAVLVLTAWFAWLLTWGDAFTTVIVLIVLIATSWRLVLLVVAAGMRALHRRMRTAWPDPAERIYRVSLALMAPARAATPSQPSGWYIVASVVLVAATAFGFIGSLARGHAPMSVGFATLTIGLGIFCVRAIARRDSGWPLAWAHAYLGLGLALVMLCAALPAALLYQDALETGIEVLARQGRMMLANRLDRRRTRVGQRYGPLGDPQLIADRLDQRLDDNRGTLFGGAIVDPPADCSPDPSNLRWTTGYVCGSSRDEDHSSTGFRAFVCGLECTHLSGILMANLPTYQAESLQLRGMLAWLAADARWSWSSRPGGAGVLTWNSPRGHGVYARVAMGADAELPAFHQPISILAWAGIACVFLLGVTLYWLLLRWLAGLALGLGREHGNCPAPPNRALIATGLFITSPHFEIDPASAEFEVIDCRSEQFPSSKWHIDRILQTAKPYVLIQHLEERFADVSRCTAKLVLLERLSVSCRKPIVVVSQIEPLGHLSRRLHSRWDEKADREISPELLARWARVLERLAWTDPQETVVDDADVLDLLAELQALQTRQPPPSLAGLMEGDTSPFALALREECSHTARLLGIGWEVWKLGDAYRLEWTDANAARERVLNAARAHYRVLWSQLTDEEQLALVQLATEGFVNPHSWSVVRVLVRKGMIRFDPRLDPAARLMSTTFEEFVKDAEAPDQISDWERADGASSWDRARSAILLFLIVGGLVLFLTQPEELTRWVGVLTAIGSAAATVVNLFGFFPRGRPSPTPAP